MGIPAVGESWESCRAGRWRAEGGQERICGCPGVILCDGGHLRRPYTVRGPRNVPLHFRVTVYVTLSGPRGKGRDASANGRSPRRVSS